MTNAHNFVLRQKSDETLPPLREHLAEQWFAPTGPRTVLYRDGQLSSDLSDASVSPILTPMTTPTLTPMTTRASRNPPAISRGTQRSKDVKRGVQGSGAATSRSAKRSCSVSTSASDDDDEPYDDRRSSDTPTNDGVKANKEREHRGSIAVMYATTQDLFRIIVPELDRLPTATVKSQNASNGNSSGLHSDKRSWIQFTESFNAELVIERLEEAQRLDDEAEREGRPRIAAKAFKERIVKKFIDSFHPDDVLSNTPFGSDHQSARCAHRKGSKSCCVHPDAPGADDWRTCRFNKLKATAKHNCNVLGLRLLQMDD